MNYCTIILLAFWFIINNGNNITINRKICKNDIDCGVQFNDISRKLKLYVNFECEYLLEGPAFDGAVWVVDKSYPKDGYLLFTVLRPPEQTGLYKLVEDNNNIVVDLLTQIPSSADVAWSPATPKYAYITSLFAQEIVVVNLETYQIAKTYTIYEGKQFAGPDGITADNNGNIYFTDTDYNVNDDANPDTTLAGGNLFRINAKTDEIFLEGKVQYGYNGITLNNVYGNGKRLVASNTVDLPDDIYNISDYSVTDVNKIFIAEYHRRVDGSLKDRGTYYSIMEHLDRFPQKTFLDGMTFDNFGNLYVAVMNMSMSEIDSKLVILDYNDQSDGFTDYIGEIMFEKGYYVIAVTMANDGYLYASLINDTEGQLVRFKTPQYKDEL